MQVENNANGMKAGVMGGGNGWYVGWMMTGSEDGHGYVGGEELLSADEGETFWWRCWERNFQEEQQEKRTKNGSEMNPYMPHFLYQPINSSGQNEFQRGFKK